MDQQHNFQVDLQGVIDLLSDHLYSNPKVYLRELMQNAVDAITARKHVEPEHEPTIDLEIFPEKENQPATLIVADNGIGLTEEEVHRFLATIGQSSKRGEENREDFIGQFGIGLLSAFVVSEEIVVLTQSAKPGTKAIEWRGRSDGTYSLREIDSNVPIGTQVFLRSKPDYEDYFQHEFIVETTKYYGGHLEVPIQVIHDQQKETINEPFPWAVEYEDQDDELESLLAYGKQRFGVDFVDAIPLRASVGGVEGLALVLAQASNFGSKRTHQVYVKNMLLSEKVDNLLPEWAFFVRCVVNATNLRPTASRESFFEDENLLATRAALGTQLKRYLVELARADRRRLDRMIELHYLPIKALATEDDEFFQLFINWLPFETTLGEMTFEDYRKQNSVIRYVRTRDQFRQISSVAAAQRICIINAGYEYDTRLLERIPYVLPELDIELVDVAELVQEFTELSDEEAAQVEGFMESANDALEPFSCDAEVKKFRPTNLPTLFTANEAATFMRTIDQTKDVSNELWSGVLDNVSKDSVTNANAKLCFNYHNPLVHKLTRIPQGPLQQQAVEILYVQSLLLGHYPLKSGEMSLLSTSLIGLIEAGISGHEAKGESPS